MQELSTREEEPGQAGMDLKAMAPVTLIPARCPHIPAPP